MTKKLDYRFGMYFENDKDIECQPSICLNQGRLLNEIYNQIDLNNNNDDDKNNSIIIKIKIITILIIILRMKKRKMYYPHILLLLLNL